MIKGNDNIERKPFLGSTEIAEVWLGGTLIYPDAPPDYSTKYLTLEVLDNGTTVKFTQSGLSYSVDNGSTWTQLAADTYTSSFNRGQKIMFKGQLTPSQNTGIGRFQTQSSLYKVNVFGNPMSLLFGDNFIGHTDLTGYDDAFAQLFKSLKVVSAQNLALVATTLSQRCYAGMFQGCTSLTTAPALPATTLASACYQDMFNGCSILTTAPALPATIVYANSYNSMFKDCSSLTTAPALPALTLGTQSYASMFYGCTSLTSAPVLPATVMASDCYRYMFQGCTSLTTAPELPATTLASNCYEYMFNGCTSLNYIKAMFTTTPSSTYTSNWVQGVAASGTFVKNSAATWNVTGVNGVPTGWTIETDYPKIYKKYRATYSNGSTVDGDCDGNNLVINEVTKSGLKTVVIGECVPAIVGECFADCDNLTSVIIEGNTSIDSYSFARNNGHLTSITMYSTTPPSCPASAFKYYKSGTGYVPMTSITIYVPSQSVNAYKAASGWSTYASKIQAIP